MNDQTTEAAQKALRNAPEGIYNQKALKDPTQVFYSEGKYGVSSSLVNCVKAGYQALFMPELALTRIGAEQGSEVLTKWYVTPSLRATGTTKQGSKVVVYAHQPNYFSDPVNIRNVVEGGKLVNGAGTIPQEAFDSLVAQDGNGRVFVIPYETLKQSSSGVIKVDDALEHPQTISFLGLGREDAEKYLAKHREVYGDTIGIWHCDDFNKKDPLGRLLFVGDGGSLDGVDGLVDCGRVFGVVAPEAQSAKNLEERVE